MFNISRKAKAIAIFLGVGFSLFTMLANADISPAYAEKQTEQKIEKKIEVKLPTKTLESINKLDCNCRINKIILETKIENLKVEEEKNANKAVEGNVNTDIEKEDIKNTLTNNLETKKENKVASYKDEFIYLKNIKMPKEHQEYLFNICKEKGLDYLKILALIKHESQFDSKVIGNGSNYGYMQINKVNHKNLAKTLQTKNAPLDPYVNISWGTHMLSELYKTWEKQGISNEVKEGEIFSKLDRYVLSSYNKGINGFKKYGEATSYINNIEKEYLYLNKLINKVRI